MIIGEYRERFTEREIVMRLEHPVCEVWDRGLCVLVLVYSHLPLILLL